MKGRRRFAALFAESFSTRLHIVGLTTLRGTFIPIHAANQDKCTPQRSDGRRADLRPLSIEGTVRWAKG